MVPNNLRTWFIIHFCVDIVAGLPLLLFPQWVAEQFHFNLGEPFIARLVAAAFLAIGTTSLLRRNDSMESYRAMLTLKILWSSLALFGLFLSLAQGASSAVYGPIGIFAVCWALWVYYFVKIKKTTDTSKQTTK